VDKTFSLITWKIKMSTKSSWLSGFSKEVKVPSGRAANAALVGFATTQAHADDRGLHSFTVIQTMATIFHERAPHNKSCEGMAAEVVVDGPQNVLDIDG